MSSMHLTDYDFTIKLNNKTKAMEALHQLVGDNYTLDMEGDIIIWDNYDDVLSKTTFEETFETFGWDACCDEHGDIIRIFEYEGTLYDSDRILGAIAPFVEAGSFIQMSEDDHIWRWIFNGTDCKKIYPLISWEA